ncbi:hypothetical protein CVT25_009670 [Psilocybe cyanescens]|uniref:Uncharacterized protein n=1 Tax=Psilocybe cyanescens TaxID=93625 RepID=A0A409XNT5_PSICY|nr:hypothetical protein CVT25_009670 [Psilocybe cyanescens]
MYYTDYHFHNFIQGARKGDFVDTEFHPMQWDLFNSGEALYAYLWAIRMLPSFLDKSDYSEELIAYARQTKIRCNNDYLNFIYSSLEQERKSARAAVKAYLRRAEDGTS